MTDHQSSSSSSSSSTPRPSQSLINTIISYQGVWLSCQGDPHRGLVRQPALHGRPQDRHPQVLHVGPLVPAVSHLCTHIYLLFASFCISRNVTEILRLVQAFRHSDLTGHVSLNHPILSPLQHYRVCSNRIKEHFCQALPSDWAPGGEVVPTDFTHKVLLPKMLGNKRQPGLVDY